MCQAWCDFRRPAGVSGPTALVAGDPVKAYGERVLDGYPSRSVLAGASVVAVAGVLALMARGYGLRS